MNCFETYPSSNAIGYKKRFLRISSVEDLTTQNAKVHRNFFFVLPAFEFCKASIVAVNGDTDFFNRVFSQMVELFMASVKATVSISLKTDIL